MNPVSGAVIFRLQLEGFGTASSSNCRIPNTLKPSLMITELQQRLSYYEN